MTSQSRTAARRSTRSGTQDRCGPAARRMLERFGIGRSRIDRVGGQADTMHLLPEAPSDPRNRHIGIVILRGDR